MSTGIGAALIEAQTCNGAAHVRTELDAQFEGVVVSNRCRGWHGRVAPDRIAGISRERKYKGNHANYCGQAGNGY